MNWFAQNATLLWTGGGLLAAIGIFLLLSRFFGWKIGAIAAAVVIALSQLKSALSKAERRGREQEREEAQRRHDDELQAIEEAKRLERERQQREGLDPDNPFHVDRHTGRVPDDRRP